MYVDDQGQVHDGDAPGAGGAPADASTPSLPSVGVKDVVSAVVDPIGTASRFAYATATNTPLPPGPVELATDAAGSAATFFGRKANDAANGWEIPTIVKVVAGLLAATIVGVPLAGAILAYFAARRTARLAVEAAPAIVAAGPAITAAFPQAAPVVAGAGLITAAQSLNVGAPLPADTDQHLQTLLGGGLRTTGPARSVVVVDPEATGGAPTVAGTDLLGALRALPRRAPVNVEVDGVRVPAELLGRAPKTLVSR